MIITFKAIPNQYSVTLVASEDGRLVECTFSNEFNIAQAIKCTVENFYREKARIEIKKQLGGFK
jgi:hypothetical protein